MESSPRKKVRINNKVTEIKSKSYVKDRNDSNPLIPHEIVDEAFQRIFIISLFILIQSWKLYDLVALNMNLSEVEPTISSVGKFTFVLKYALIDGIFLWFLPILNISYLVFSPIVTLLLTILFNISNVLLVSKFNISLIFTLIAPYFKSLSSQKELTLGGDKISSHAIDTDSHFKGKYTIHYLPDSLAKFNVFGLHSVCQDSESKDPFHIPIEFNTTTDVAYLEIQYTSPLNKVSYQKYTESDINKLMKLDYSHLKSNKNYVRNDDRVFYIEIPAREPGTYKINKVRDRRGSSMRYVQNQFSFAYCPNGQFSIPKLYNNNNKICVGKKIDDTSMKLPLLMLEGVSPLRAKISASFKGKKVKIIESTLTDDITDSINLNSTQFYSHKFTRNLLEQEILKDPSILQVSQSGTLQFQLLEVTDALGNVKKYNPQIETPDLRYSLDLLTKPSVRLIDMEKDRPLLVHGSKGLSFATSQNIGEQFPLSARFSYEDPNDTLRSYNFTHVFKDFDDLRAGVQVSNAGNYKLLSLIGGFCDCEIQDSIITFETVEPPTVEIHADPVVDKCIGMTGYKFKFDVIGEPPFAVEYSVYQNSSTGSLRPVIGPQGRSVQVLRSDKHQFEIDYKPPGEGNYVIIFKNLRDYNYKSSPVTLDEKKHTYSTYFKQRSKASFFQKSGSLNKNLRTCKGESTTIPIYFNGHFPFKFDYSIIETSSGKPIITKNGIVSNEEIYEISTSAITNGGTYKIELSNIHDGSSCAVDYVQAENIQVITRSDMPEISFDFATNEVHHKIVEGDSIQIPLKVKSSIGRSNNDKIEYEVTDLNNPTNKRRSIISGKNNLLINTPGIYKLISFSNGGCKGTISSEKIVHVSFYERPQLSIDVPPELKEPSSVKDNIILKSGCQDCKREVTIQLEGKPPFNIEYEIKFPSGKTDFRTMTVDKKSLKISLQTAQSGLYQHNFKAIYDQQYSKGKGRSKTTLPSISYDIYESPIIEFEKATTVLICEAALGSEISELSKIPIKLHGQPPFKLDLSISGDNLRKPKYFTLNDINEPILDISNALDSKNEFIWKHLKQGEYVIGIEKVSDTNGCIHNEFHQLNQLVISVTPSPDISPFILSKKDFCVGDHVGYDLTGAAPFVLHYEFNNKTHESRTDTEFRRLAAKPGVIKVTGIEDSSAGRCLINVPKGSKKSDDLEITIHDLPSVEINQGDTIIQDIHEGDLTEMRFTFTGTPPFTVTYVRTLDPNSKAKRSKNSRLQKNSKKITETTTVKDIWEYEYSVNVGLEGTYEAIEIIDAYCMAKKDFAFN